VEASLQNIALGLEVLLDAQALTFLTLGLVAGFVVGVLPGFGGGNAAALVLPFSLTLPAEVALLLIAGIYAGASFAGAIPAILINVPGTAGAAATAIDGYPMARKGQADLAIGVARMASVLGGVIATTFIIFMLTPISRLALTFGSREQFAIAALGLTIIGTVVGKDFRKGMISALLGLLLAAMSTSPTSARPRYTFGFLELFEGVPFIPAIVGLFAITEMLLIANKHSIVPPEMLQQMQSQRKTFAASLQDIFDGIRTTLRNGGLVLSSASIGLVLGAVPGIGTAVANFISYGFAKRRDKTGMMGEGHPRGVIASEACDNAVTAGTLVPTFTLGIPGSAVAAVMLTALYLNGIQPGPRVLVTHPGEVFAVLLGLLLASILILPFGIILATPLTRIIRVPVAILVPTVIVFAIIGAFAIRSSMFDASLAVLFGILGFLMRRRDYPVVPLILGLILGPIAESNFARAVQLSGGEWTYFIGSTTSRVLWGLLVLLVVSQLAQTVFRRRFTTRVSTETVEERAPRA
jgi:putative tricarboxylic transport membrane protein